jgi:radical SAM superfamily enzyme YgiQ (UPF0313 family)
MSSLGYLTLFRILDQNKDVYPERIFVDTEKTFHNPENIELFGFSFSFELDFIGIFKVLQKYNIPLKSKDRNDSHPIIFGGGPVLTANPEPYAEFFDVITLGDGENILTELVNSYQEVRNLESRQEKLLHLSSVEGAYIPSLYDVSYNDDFTISEFNPNNSIVPATIIKRSEDTAQNCFYSPILTDKSMFSNMFLIEVSRGCPKKCCFCLASYLNLPARYPDLECIKQAIEIGIEHSNTIGFLGALITEHPEFDQICDYFNKINKEKKVKISVASLRGDKISPEIVSTLVNGGQNNVTVAIEAGSERLRKVINKNLTDENIYKSVETARLNGLSGMKFYGITGLPTEEQDDVEQIIELMNNIKIKNKGFKLTLSVSSFVPKAQTPFQWEARESVKELQTKIEFLRKELHKLGIEFKPTSIKWDYVQAVLSRGDRRLTPLIERVFQNGGSLGSWSRSIKELQEEGLNSIPDLDWYALRKKQYDEILPWDFIYSGIDKNTLVDISKNTRKNI